MLRRLELRFGRIIALMGRLPRAGGDVGGDSIIHGYGSAVRLAEVMCRCVTWQYAKQLRVEGGVLVWCGRTERR